MNHADKRHSELTSAASAAQTLIADVTWCHQTLCIAMPDAALRVHSNDAAVLVGLEAYFGHLVTPEADAAIDLWVVQSSAPELPVNWQHWAREPGKTGYKDAIYDLPDARLIRKVRTGLVFLQSQQQRIAAGPCLDHLNQVVNFINNQYMSLLQQRGWLICHAAAVATAASGLAIAGFSGGGKSTLMLHLLEQPSLNYLTNDRLFIRADGGQVAAKGIAKWPRVNPGTLLNNSRLNPLLSEADQRHYAAMPTDELWQCEHKFDVDITRFYGEGRFTPEAQLDHLLILNWQRLADAPAKAAPVVLEQRQDLLAAVTKPSGPFHQYADGRFYPNGGAADNAPYLTMLKGLTVHEVTGGVDFAALNDYCLALLK